MDMPQIPPKASKKLAIVAFAYTLFVIYGSLVPLTFTSMSLGDAWQQYSEAYLANWSMARRSDWFANFLLFIPLTYLWQAILWKPLPLSRNIISSVTLLIAAWLLTSSIEFLQVFFVGRVVSVNDIIAETLGGLMGLTLWWLSKEQFFSWLKRLESKNRWKAYIELYVVLMFAYNLMPLDLSLSPVEIYQKWKQGMVLFIPYVQWGGDPFRLFFTFLFELTLWLALSLLLIKSDKAPSKALVITKVTLIALALEVCQLFVLSRFSDISDVFTAAIGAILATTLLSHRITFSKKGKQLLKYAPLISIICWCIVLLIVYWYPYNFNVDKYYIRSKLSDFWGPLFFHYQAGSELIAITQILRKALLAVPIGLALGWHSRQQVKLSALQLTLYTLLATFIFFGVELGQLLIRGKVVHQTDAWLGVFGCIGALFAFRSVVVNRNFEEKEPTETTSKKASSYIIATAPFWGTLLFLIVIALLPQTPYNLKELLQGSNIFTQTTLITIFLFLFLGAPYSITQHIYDNRTKHHLIIKQLLIAFSLHLASSAILLRLIAPRESLHDVIGSPTWGYLIELEYFYRATGFLSIISGALFFVAIGAVSKQSIKSKWEANKFLYRTFYIAVVIPFSFLVVVVDAGTNNITELLRNSGYSLNIIALPLYLLLTFYLAITLRYKTQAFSLFQKLTLIAFVLSSFPIGYYALQLATEPLLIKYNKVFSALQFLLSKNRENYISGEQLFLRFCAFQATLLLLGIFLQASFLKKINTNLLKETYVWLIKKIKHPTSKKQYKSNDFYINKQHQKINSEIPSLHGLRALAALSVFVVHFQQFSGVSGSALFIDFERWMINGNTGVALFFVLSGFLLSQPLWQRLEQGLKPSFKDYFIRRIVRIAPLYYLCLFGLLMLQGFKGSDANISNIISHILFLHNLHEKQVMSIIPPFWTIAVEMQFYLLLPLLFWLLLKIPKKFRFTAMVGLILISYLSFAQLMQTLQRSLDWPIATPFFTVLSSPNSAVLTYSIWAHLSHFLLGVIAAWFYLNPNFRISPKKANQIFYLSFISIFIILSTSLDDVLQLPHGRYNFPYIPVLLASVIYSAPQAPAARAILDNNALRWGGVISYGIYLFHYPIQKAVIKLMSYFDALPQTNSLLFFITSLALTLTVAHFAYCYFERPILRKFSFSSSINRRPDDSNRIQQTLVP